MLVSGSLGHRHDVLDFVVNKHSLVAPADNVVRPIEVSQPVHFIFDLLRCPIDQQMLGIHAAHKGNVSPVKAR